ncbi:FACT complex subunit POB3 [Psilocybe cubensis]|uniref:FACT complex subunit POB3 n=2 Tax=Psilocybe cubensis TaxID=181762 RepID=A0ACB8GYK3_PSICU|nr:FACT complex subunit POB3 [Psilocybe cubensis]KAH9480828.1 FACT complex subunit POB3 [Psilocybe cubensis]
MTTQYDRIYHGMSPETGKFRMAPSGMAWKGIETEAVTAIPNTDVKWAQWLRVARGFRLRVGMKDHKRDNFDGFAREDHDKLAKTLQTHFGVTLETVETSFKGWNWGVADFHGEELAFMVSDRTAFELPLRHVANSNIAGKTEVSLEFSNLTPSASSSNPKSAALLKQAGDELTEIRFFVPGTITKLKGSSSDAGSDAENDNEDEEEISAAQVFHDTIKEKASISVGSGDLILSFDEILVLTPRGRYDMDMFKDFLRLRGKTYDYKVLYGSISRLFLLPKDDQQVLFILGLSTPIRQGQTLYQYLVMQFTREEEITAELNMSDEDLAKYDKLKKNYEDPTYEVVSSVFRALSGKKIIGSGSFQSRDGHPGFKANLKAIQGDLFMLERYIFFVSKSPLLIELADIHTVTFSRVGSASAAQAGRTFDIHITLKSGGPEHTFTSINKEEHEIVDAYLKDKKVRVKNEMVPDADLLMAAVGAGDDDDDDDDDEDMASVLSSEEEARRRRAKAKAKASGGGAVKTSGGMDDDDSEDDEDFEASESDSGSPSDSDSSDGSGAETASDASGDMMLTKPKPKPKAKAAKGKGKDNEDGDGGSPPKKVVKKKAPVKDKDGSDAEKPKPKPKPKAKKEDDAMDVDGEGKPKPKPKPKAAAKPNSSSKAGPSNGDAMDVDVDGEDKPKPKFKPKAPAAVKKDSDAGVEPPKKKMKKTD